MKSSASEVFPTQARDQFAKKIELHRPSLQRVNSTGGLSDLLISEEQSFLAQDDSDYNKSEFRSNSIGAY
jgi:hypothetical protein